VNRVAETVHDFQRPYRLSVSVKSDSTYVVTARQTASNALKGIRRLLRDRPDALEEAFCIDRSISHVQ